MLITYKPATDHIKCIPLIPDIKNPQSYSRGMVQLVPGTNEITDNEWEAIKPHLAVELKNGEIAVLEIESGKTKNGEAGSIKDVPINAARGIIQECNNPATLKKWLVEESRDEVLAAVTKQMRKLKIDPEEIEAEIEKAAKVAVGNKADGNGEKPLEGMSREELLAYAKEKNISIAANGGEAEILAAIKKAAK